MKIYSGMLEFLQNLDPEIVRVGPLAIRWYGLAYLTCILYGYWRVRDNYQRVGLSSKEQVDTLSAFFIIGMILGARIFYVFIYNFEEYASGPFWKAFAVWEGGLSFHGAVFGIMVATWIFCRRYKASFWMLTDCYSLVAPLGLGLGRVTNFINGELYGRITDSSWGVVFKTGGPFPRHPSQLYEAFLEGIVLFIILHVLWRFRFRAGVISGVFGIGYAVMRTFVEQFREPDAQLGFFWGGITMGQILSVIMLLAGIAVLYRGIKYGKPWLEADEASAKSKK